MPTPVVPPSPSSPYERKYSWVPGREKVPIVPLQEDGLSAVRKKYKSVHAEQVIGSEIVSVVNDRKTVRH
jgi:hypothetical protein